MKQITLDFATVNETIGLIQEYLHQGGTGFDADRLAEMLDTLISADLIRIVGGEE
jgi:hypothetical protein